MDGTRLTRLQRAVARVGVQNGIRSQPLRGDVGFQFLVDRHDVLQLRESSSVGSVFFSSGVRPYVCVVVVVVVLNVFARVLVPIVLVSREGFIAGVPIPGLAFIDVQCRVVNTSITFAVFVLRFVARLRGDDFHCQFIVDRFYHMVVILHEEYNVPPIVVVQLSNRYIGVTHRYFAGQLAIIVAVARYAARYGIASRAIRPPIRLREDVDQGALAL